MAKIKVITDEDGGQYVVMSYATFEEINRKRARLLGLSGQDDVMASVAVTHIECTDEEWSDLQEWIGPLDEESGPAVLTTGSS